MPARKSCRRRFAATRADWQWQLLRMYAKPTIAMVNGWCFGGGFSPLVACDLAIAADEAVFGLSEINWGIPPGNLVSKAMADTVGHRQALYYIMTGDTFTGPEAAQMGLVNKSVPRAQLREETLALAAKLLEKNPVVLRAAKHGFKRCRELTWEQNEDYLYAKLDQAQLRDPEARPRTGSQTVPRRQERSSRVCRLTSAKHAGANAAVAIRRREARRPDMVNEVDLLIGGESSRRIERQDVRAHQSGDRRGRVACSRGDARGCRRRGRSGSALRFPHGPRCSPTERRKRLLAAADLMDARTAEFIATGVAETGAMANWYGFNVMLAANMLREAAAMTTQIDGSVIPSDVPGSLALAVRQPCGVVLGMAPWNAPVILAHARARHAARVRQYGGAEGVGGVSRRASADRHRAAGSRARRRRRERRHAMRLKMRRPSSSG